MSYFIAVLITIMTCALFITIDPATTRKW